MENWKDIEGFEGLYQISDMGRVKSFHKNKEIILKLINHTGGYKNVILQQNDISVHKYVHRLVGQHFINNPLELKEINHKDGVKSNNVVYNLEWCNRHENHMHAINNGLNNKKGERHHNHKLTELQVNEIISLKNKLYQKDIAKKFGVSETAISHILNKKRWKHI